MAIRIKFDSTYNAIPPVFVLATRKGRKLGIIPADEIVFKDGMTTPSEVNFCVYKENNGVKYHLWDALKDFKLMYCRDWDTWFELSIDLEESTECVKKVHAVSLGESELSQINIYGLEVNTEIDIARDDYSPTILFDEDNPASSLLNRMLEKAPHYRIDHVDLSISKIQRSFSFDGISIYDAFQDVASEINCVFIIGSHSDSDGNIDRSVSVFDLESFCLDCGKRDNFLLVCPECGSKNVLHGYGEDTSIFVSTDNLADNINYSTDVASVKNCFKLTAGDDLMTATIMNCNPNGSGYIWYISDDTKEDMSEELVAKLNEYDDRYEYYQKKYEINPDATILDLYNELIDKYSVYSDNLKKISDSIVGYHALMNAYYNTIDFYLLLNNSLMPDTNLRDTSAEIEATKLTAANISPVAVQSLTKVSSATASSSVLAMARVIVDSRYQVKIQESSFENTTWSGSFIVTNYSDEEDTATASEISVEINDNYEEFVKQKIEKLLNKNTDSATDIVSLFGLDDDSFISELKKYSLSRLNAFHDSCQSCLDILIEQGIADMDTWSDKEPDLYTSLYLSYYNKLGYIAEEIKVRESEISTIIGSFDADGDLESAGLQTILDEERSMIQDALNFEDFLGEDLWLEFVAYRREDTYQNDNYISDGLDNAELFENALEFIETAKKDIYKSATLQHSISATLKNLLVMKEFKPIIDHFEVGNWIRARVDGVVYRLRLLDYEINFNDLGMLNITFSDVKSIATGTSDAESVLSQAASMATSYGSVSRQAGQGKKSNEKLDDWVTKGLALTKMKIIDDAENQNITFDSHGLLCKEYLPITDTYDEKQLKMINRGIYLTDDNWLTSRAGIGDFSFYNPETGKMEETYGVIADTLVGNLILSEKVGVYNTQNSISLDEHGIVITTDNTTDETNRMAFTIQKKLLNSDGAEYIDPIMYIDSNGDLVLNGTVRINANTDDTISSLNDLADTGRFTDYINETVYAESKNIYNTIDQKYNMVMEESTKQLEDYKADLGQYLRYDENGLTLGASSSEFSTVIDNKGLYFKQGNAIVSYINNSRLHIPNAVIEQTLILGNFFFSPREDGGVSLTWQGD